MLRGSPPCAKLRGGDLITGNRHRLLRHLGVLVAAVTLPLVAPQAVATLSSVAATGPDSSVALSASIERTTGPIIVSRPAQAIVVQTGETLNGIAAEYHVSSGALRWANGLKDGQDVSVGQTLLIPPSSGGLVRVLPDERPSQFAARLHLDPSLLLDYNFLAHDSPEPAGTYLQVPPGVSAGGEIPADSVVPVAAGVPGVSADQHSRGNMYPYGQCTYYVASRRNVTWSGNAVDWWGAARGIRPEGEVPVAGAIVVFNTGYVGHVAYVESVNPDGSYTISEMNYYGNGGGWGRVDERQLAPSTPGVMGFIY